MQDVGIWSVVPPIVAIVTGGFDQGSYFSLVCRHFVRYGNLCAVQPIKPDSVLLYHGRHHDRKAG